jgi:hypothetical protein
MGWCRPREVESSGVCVGPGSECSAPLPTVGGVTRGGRRRIMQRIRAVRFAVPMQRIHASGKSSLPPVLLNPSRSGFLSAGASCAGCCRSRWWNCSGSPSQRRIGPASPSRGLQALRRRRLLDYSSWRQSLVVLAVLKAASGGRISGPTIPCAASCWRRMLRSPVPCEYPSVTVQEGRLLVRSTLSKHY